jgi:hypothetical protein
MKEKNGLGLERNRLPRSEDLALSVI